jgi:hypothetical protein
MIASTAPRLGAVYSWESTILQRTGQLRPDTSELRAVAFYDVLQALGLDQHLGAHNALQ